MRNCLVGSIALGPRSNSSLTHPAAKLAKSKKVSKILVPKQRVKPAPAPRSALGPSVKEQASESSDETESSEEDSDYNSSDEELDIVEPSPLPETRPPGAKDAVRYDTIKALWLPRSRSTQGERIRTGLKDFWEVIRTIRDRWKTDGEVVKKAEEAKKNSELPMLRERVTTQREMMEIALHNALEHGHPDIISLYVESPFLCVLHHHAVILELYTEAVAFRHVNWSWQSEGKQYLRNDRGTDQHSNIKYDISPLALKIQSSLSEAIRPHERFASSENSWAREGIIIVHQMHSKPVHCWTE